MFHISTQNIEGGAVLTSPHKLCFEQKYAKIMYAPVSSSFTMKKWGLRGSKLYKYVFVIIYAHSGKYSEDCARIASKIWTALEQICSQISHCGNEAKFFIFTLS